MASSYRKSVRDYMHACQQLLKGQALSRHEAEAMREKTEEIMSRILTMPSKPKDH